MSNSGVRALIVLFFEIFQLFLDWQSILSVKAPPRVPGKEYVFDKLLYGELIVET